MEHTQPETLTWRKATASSADGGNCVEVADLPGGGRALRDSKHGEASPILRFTAAEWAAFADGMSKGEFA